MGNGFSTIVGVDEKPQLMPVNAYTDEIIQKLVIERRNLASSDSGMAPYLRTVQADGMGNFSFHGVPAGNYYVVSKVEAGRWIWNTDQDGNLYKITIIDRTPVYARVSIHDGQTINVTNWSKGKTKAS